MTQTKHKVLLVEDDLPLTRMYQFVLEKADCTVITALDGEEALKKSTEPGIELVLLDLVLPKRDGFSVLQELKDRHFKVPIVCLTVLHQEEDIKKAKDLGAADYLVKSDLSPEEVVVRVLSYLQPGSQRID